jgi:hypothetical protein
MMPSEGCDIGWNCLGSKWVSISILKEESSSEPEQQLNQLICEQNEDEIDQENKAMGVLKEQQLGEHPEEMIDVMDEVGDQVFKTWSTLYAHVSSTRCSDEDE